MDCVLQQSSVMMVTSMMEMAVVPFAKYKQVIYVQEDLLNHLIFALLSNLFLSNQFQLLRKQK